MARRPRLAVPALPHHVIQRGNNRQAIFFADADYRFFLGCLAKAKARYSCRLYAYVLMTNHVHLLLEPLAGEHLSLLMQSVGRRYVRYVNDTYGRSGTLWEGRFKSAVVSHDAYLLACTRYIERNPVRAQLAARPETYPWSSVHFHTQGTSNPLLDEDPAYAALGETAAQRQGAYRGWLVAGAPEGEVAAIREATHKGLLIGPDTFQRQMETVVGRRLVGEQRGRPRKQREESLEKVL
jgi:putative transposase